MLDATNHHHSLTIDGGENGSQTVQSEGYHLKILSSRVSNGFFRSGYDQDLSAVKSMPEFDCNERLSSLPLLVNGSRS